MEDEILKSNEVEAPKEKSIARQAIEALIETFSSPNPIKLAEDLALAVKLVEEFKEKTKHLDPSIANIIKAIL